MKRLTVRCPYCGSKASKRPASYVYGEKADKSSYLYVCDRYPVCDSYVAAHEKSGLPMGTLANADLRKLRIEAHKALDIIWQSGYMSRTQEYKWLQAKLDLPASEMHIGHFNEYYCKLLIAECRQAYRNMRSGAREVVR